MVAPARRKNPCFGLIAAHHRKHLFGKEGFACLRVLLLSHRCGAPQNPVHLDFARLGVRSKQREARRAQKAIRVSRSLAASPPMICVLPQVLWVSQPYLTLVVGNTIV